MGTGICPFCGKKVDKFIMFRGDVVGCRYCGIHTKQTNADRIRAMTDEELAEWITELADSAVYPYTRKDAPCISIGQTCAASWIDWLKQEAVSNG